MPFGVNPATGRPGPAPNPPRDGDKVQARQRINVQVRNGLRLHPNTLPCTDCGHEWKPGVVIDLAAFRKCDGIGRNILISRIAELCDELHENRTEAAWDSEVHARVVRDNAALNANVSAVQARCSSLLEEVRALRRELGR